MGKKKTTWNDIYKEFRKLYPNRAKGSVGFQPHGYGTILIYFPDNKRVIYDQVNNTVEEIVVE